MDVNSKYNYYEILEVSPQSHQSEVSLAYEKMKMTYGGDNPAIYTIFSEDEARAMLNLVEEAFSVLGNKALRTDYDEKMNFSSKDSRRSQDSSSTGGSARASFRAQDNAKRTPLYKPEYTVDENIESEIKSCSNWDGNQIRKIREYKGWTVETLAETTKISGYYIQGIERVEPSALPAPVFVRGYVSQICRVLSLDEKRVCDSYMKTFKQALERK
jgi:curved DNA-binding protein CbpA